MKLISLKLSNFQGIKDLTFTPNGNNADVFGSNGTGKTTLYNAFTWLLFDKPSTGAKGFSPKTRDESGDVHFLNHRVDGVFQNGLKEISFAKDFHEVYIQKRGSNAKDFSGHSTEYFVNSVPVSKNEYDSRIAEICPPDKAMILTQPMYFAETLDWKERRKILLDVCGDFDDVTVIAANSDLADLPKYLDGHTVEEYRLITAQSIKRINADLEQIPARIDEANKAIADTGEYNEDDTKEQIRLMQAQAEELTQKKVDLANSSSTVTIRQRIAELNAQLMEASNAQDKAYDESVKADKELLYNLNVELGQINSAMGEIKNKKQTAEQKLEQAKALRERYTAEYKSEKYKVYNGETVCPFCGQDLPAEKIETAQADFNKHKSDALEKITAAVNAQCSKEVIARLETDIAELQAILDHTIDEYMSKEKAIKALTDNMPARVNFTEAEEYRRISAEISAEQDKLQAGTVDTIAEQNAIQGNIDTIKVQIQEQNNILALFSTAQAQYKRIDELKAQEKQLAADYENLKRGLYLCELFTRKKVSMLTDSINVKFKSVKFSLFEEQINGGVKEICEVLIPCAEGLVDYARANNAARINAGLEIIDTLGTHWGVNMPIFIDNAESVVELIPVKAQVIRLIVSGEHKTLTF